VVFNLGVRKTVEMLTQVAFPDPLAEVVQGAERSL